MVYRGCMAFMYLCFYVTASIIEEGKPSREGDNEVTQRKSAGTSRSAFSSDADVAHYLKLYGTEVMIWRCRNAIKRVWYRKPLPYIELYCEIVGRIRDVAWYHNRRKLDIDSAGSRYELLVLPHHVHDRYYSYWIDFHLRIHRASHHDKGVYTFEVEGLHGQKHTQKIYLDISERPRHRPKPTRRRSPHAPSFMRDRKKRHRRRSHLKRRRRRRRREGVSASPQGAGSP